MSTGYSWEGIRQVRATLLGARHVSERLCCGRVYLGRYIKCSTFLPSTFTVTVRLHVHGGPQKVKFKLLSKYQCQILTNFHFLWAHSVENL